MPRAYSLLALLCTTSAAMLLSAQSPMFSYVVPVKPDPLLANLNIPASAATQGMWSPVQSWPLNGLHLTVLPDGRVLSFGAPLGIKGVQDGRTLDIWDPSRGFVPASHVPLSNGQLVDSFCAAATLLPSGLALLSGGASTASGYTAFANTVVNGAASTAKASTATLAAQRWYGTMMTLADGRQLMTGGGTPYAIVNAYQNPSAAEPNISETPEVYDPAKGWSSLMGANSAYAFGPVNNRAWYPRQWVAPDGTVFGISTDVMWSLNPAGNGGLQQLGNFKTTVDNTALPNVGPTSTAVMYDAGKVLQAGGNGYNNGYASNSSPYATVFDISRSGAPVVRDTQSMRYPRQWGSSTVLPDGTVAVTGGSTYADNAGNNAVYAAELWNPKTGAWTLGANAAVYRGYHSAVALLPDGVLLSDGGGAPGPVDNLNAELYYPPYLFKVVNGSATLAQRPSIISLSTSTPDFNSTLSAQVNSTATVSEVALIGLSSVTHSFNTSQRRIRPAFTQSGAVLSITMPNANLTPPGYYMLVVLDSNRVPSVGAIVGVHASAPPATSVTALLPVDSAPRSLQLAASPGQVVRQANFLAVVAGVTPQASSQADRNDASFLTRPGLANPSCYSFESLSYPGYFLRHYAFRVRLSKNDNSSQLAQDSTFCAVSALSGQGFSLRSSNYPDRYLHMRSGGDVWVDQQDGTADFNASASFLHTSQFLPTDSALHSFANYTIENELVRHANFVGYIASINSASAAGDRADASFIVHPGNSSAACYSFEASNYPGKYLRHQNYALRLDTNDNSTGFAQDSTFCLNSGLAGSGISFTAINFPTYYLRQQNQQLYLRQNDNSAQFPSDATFAITPAP